MESRFGRVPLFPSPLPISRDEQTGSVRNKAHILLVEDNPADVNLVREAMDEYGVDCELSVITDGAEAVAFMDHIDATSGRLSKPRLCSI